MAEPVGASGSVSDTVALGMQLATALQTYLQFGWSARTGLHGLAIEVNATASVLRQLQNVLDSNQAIQGRPGAFKDAAVTEMHTLAQKCHLLFKTIIIVIEKSCETDKDNKNGGDSASDSGSESASDDDDATSTEPKESIKERAADPFTGPSALKVNLLSKVNWRWLGKRADRCYEQLQWLKMTLLLHLQIANLGELHTSTSTGSRPAGTFDQELGLRITAEKMRARQLKFAKGIANRQERARRTAEYGASDTSSESSESSTQVDDDDDSAGPTKTTDEPDIKSNSPAKTAEDGAPSNVPVVQELSSSAPPYSPHAHVGHQAFPVPGPATGVNAIMAGPSSKEKPTSGDEKTADWKGLIPDTPSSNSDDATMDQDAFDVKASLPADPASVSALFRPSFSDRIAGFFRGIVGKQDKLKSMKDGVLEAYLVSTDDARPVPLPFGHQQLKEGLARALRKKNGSSLNGFLAMSPSKRKLVDRVIKGWSYHGTPCVRTCIAIDECRIEGQLPSYILFFSVAEPQAPIVFRDALGRRFKFPYEICKEWHDMECHIRDAFMHVEVVGPHVQQGHYDLLKAGEVVLPKFWGATIRPGDLVTMHMWPMDKLPRPGFPMPVRGLNRHRPGFNPPMPPGPRMPPGLALGRGLPPPPCLPPPPGPNMFNRPPGAPGMNRIPRPPEIIEVMPGRPPKLQTSRPRRLMVGRPSKRKIKQVRKIMKDVQELEVVNFVEAANAKGNDVADMIRRFTYITDAESTALNMLSINSDDDADISDYAPTKTASSVTGTSESSLSTDY
ncbi:hypothetical protein B0T24DRAFT_694254 [Lasiosphaeria ovina]|uniref:Ubiquitin-like domain-containing protein n=1 Tax=Lasiosphaeria ovina TaxID=92902 RepID=A0AAE0KN72_9PEZI|nr:hypothetical protein B0T24DRAFT_694254 [Lasiosphaeria ovina]